MLAEPRQRSPGPTRSHLQARPHPRQRLLSSCHPSAAAPSPARPPPLTSSSGVRLSRSPQQQHHLQQQHTVPLHPAIFLLSSRSGPPRPNPPLPPPRIRVSRDWSREGHVALSSSGSGDREWLQTGGVRELASHDAVLGLAFPKDLRAPPCWGGTSGHCLLWLPPAARPVSLSNR